MDAIYHIPRPQYPHGPLCGTSGFTACVEGTKRQRIEQRERDGDTCRLYKGCPKREA